MTTKSTYWAMAALMVASAAAFPSSARAEDKGVQSSLAYPLEAIKKASADALTVIGCEIKKNEDSYIEGVRTRKFGAFVGSGGETVSVKLTAVDGKTSVDVRTKKTFVGGAGQKNWDQQVIDEIAKELSAAPAAAAGAN